MFEKARKRIEKARVLKKRGIEKTPKLKFEKARQLMFEKAR